MLTPDLLKCSESSRELQENAPFKSYLQDILRKIITKEVTIGKHSCFNT